MAHEAGQAGAQIGITPEMITSDEVVSAVATRLADSVPASPAHLAEVACLAAAQALRLGMAKDDCKYGSRTA